MVERTNKTMKKTRGATRTRSTAATSTRKTTRSRASRSAITEQQIRERAYQIYLARSGGPGDAMSDWFQAELQLRG